MYSPISQTHDEPGRPSERQLHGVIDVPLRQNFGTLRTRRDGRVISGCHPLKALVGALVHGETNQ